MKNLIFTTLMLLTMYGLTVANHKTPDTYQKTRQLLIKVDVTHPNKEFAYLFENGDERIADLIRALQDEDGEIQLRAQVIIRYLANAEGIKALHDIYAKQTNISLAGSIPTPLDDWDYQFIRSHFFAHRQETWSIFEFQYVSALMLDGSPRAEALLKEIEKSHSLREVEEFFNRTKVKNMRQVFSGEGDLSKLVLSHAFFVDSQDRQYASARLIALNGAKTRALVEIYINRGPLAEEWWNVVVDKQGNGWRFNSVYQAAVS